jgi:hypothetical protein
VDGPVEGELQCAPVEAAAGVLAWMSRAGRAPLRDDDGQDGGFGRHGRQYEVASGARAELRGEEGQAAGAMRRRVEECLLDSFARGCGQAWRRRSKRSGALTFSGWRELTTSLLLFACTLY